MIKDRPRWQTPAGRMEALKPVITLLQTYWLLIDSIKVGQGHNIG